LGNCNSNNNSLLTKDFDYHADENDQESVDLFNDILFAPAEYTDGIKRRKEKKRRERREERNKKLQQQQQQLKSAEQERQEEDVQEKKTVEEKRTSTSTLLTIPSSTTDATMRLKNSNKHITDSNNTSTTNTTTSSTTDDDAETGDTRVVGNGELLLPSSGCSSSNVVETSSLTTVHPIPPQSGNSSAYTAVPQYSQESSVSSYSTATASPVRNDMHSIDHTKNTSNNSNSTNNIQDRIHSTKVTRNAEQSTATTIANTVAQMPAAAEKLATSKTNVRTQSPIKTKTTAIELEHTDENPIPWWMSCLPVPSWMSSFPDTIRSIISTHQY
jgi:hypothetical protein